MFDLRHITLAAIVDLFIFGGLLDVLFALFGGNRSTISRVWLDLTGKHPELLAEMAYALVLFYLHLNFAKFEEPPSFLVGLAKALVCLFPVFRMVWLVHTAAPADDAGYVALVERSTPEMVVLALAGAVAAVPAWWWGVPQHVTN